MCRGESEQQLRGLKGLFSLANLKNLLVGVALAVAFQLTGSNRFSSRTSHPDKEKEKLRN
jgi:hypothetical protein